MRLAYLSIAVALGLASPAAAWLAPNSLTVTDQGGGRFEVHSRGGLSNPDAFCAAGDYAVQQLNLVPTARIWRVSPPPRRSGEGIVFSTSPDGAAPKTGLFMFGTDDGSVSVAFAQQMCDRMRLMVK